MASDSLLSFNLMPSRIPEAEACRGAEPGEEPAPLLRSVSKRLLPVPSNEKLAVINVQRENPQATGETLPQLASSHLSSPLRQPVRNLHSVWGASG